MRAWFALIVGLALALRLSALSWLPTPNGDEGNWGLYAAQIYAGKALEIEPAYRGGSPVFAYLLGFMLHLTGPSFWGLRLLVALSIPMACAACYLLLARAGARRAGVAVAALLALHPTSVIWSRTASVPYALALGLMTLGLVLFWLGLSKRSGLAIGAAVLVITATANFSPLSFVLVPPCALFALLPAHRWLLRDRAVVVSGLLAVSITVPLWLWMRTTPSAVNAEIFSGLGLRAWSASFMMITGVLGEASLRYFTTAALPVTVSMALGVLFVSGLFIASALAKPGDTPGLTHFGLCVFASSFVLLPLVLSSARLWYLPSIDSERYVFALLPGLGLCLGGLAEDTRVRLSRVPVLASTWWLVASLRMLGALSLGHGVYTSAPAIEGGQSYWGWLTTQSHEAPADVVREVATRVHASTVLYDGYPFHVLRFTLFDLPIVYATYKDAAKWQDQHGRFVFVIWANHVTGRDKRASKRNRQRRRFLHSEEFTEQTLERRLLQPDGTPLMEIWSAKRAVRSNVAGL